MAIILSERAATEVKKVLEEQKQPEALLRVRVVGGGCSGFSYDLRFDNTFDEKLDSKYEYHGVTVVVDKKSALYLDGTTVDYYGSRAPTSRGPARSRIRSSPSLISI